MKTTMMRLLAASMACALPAAADAAVLNVKDGTLLGASGVMVDGKSYDVAFVDGSCDTAFNSCSSGSFAFRTESGARAAATALFDQVLIGDYDTEPGRTFGCGKSPGCAVVIPWAVANDFDPEVLDDIVYTIIASNTNKPQQASISVGEMLFSSSLGSDAGSTLAYSHPRRLPLPCRSLRPGRSC